MYTRKYRFCLNPGLSPTYYNLHTWLQKNGWRFTRYNFLSDFSEKNFNFNLNASKVLEFKHLLAQIVLKYCPDVMPETYCINDTNWSFVLSKISEYYMKDTKLVDQVDNLVWILKPSLLNNGQQIKIFECLSQLEQHYLSSNRLGGEHVLQRYLTKPDLINGHKYSIRMFVVITNYAGAFIYPFGYYNIANHPYLSNRFNDLGAHLTNEHLSEDELNVTQKPTQNFEQFSYFYQQIKIILASVISGLKQIYPQAFICKKQRTCAIFGFDFMVDTDMRVWLLEANHGPCFPINAEHPLQKYLYDDFWQAFIKSFVLPIAMRQPIEQIQYQLFEWVKV